VSLRKSMYHIDFISRSKSDEFLQKPNINS